MRISDWSSDVCSSDLPTAIATTIDALRRAGPGRILAVLEPRSNTMRLGTHARELAGSLSDADRCFVYARPDLKWDAASALAGVGRSEERTSEIQSLMSTSYAVFCVKKKIKTRSPTER